MTKGRRACYTSSAIIFFWAILTFFSGVCYAGVNQWTPLGPEGGEIELLVTDSVTPTTLYAVTKSGLFKSINGGNSWQYLTNATFTYNYYPYISHISAFAIDPITPSTLYAGIQDAGVFKSMDGGKTWVLIKDEIASVTSTSLAIDPLNPEILYIGARDFSSSDLGGVFRSTDQGETWTAVNNGLDKNVTLIAIDPLTPTTLYAVTESGIFKSNNSGGKWSMIYEKTWINAFAINPLNPGILFAGFYEGIVKSPDGGETWQPLDSETFTEITIRSLAVDPFSTDVIFAGTDRGVYKTINGGENWQTTEDELTGTPVSVLATDRMTPGIIYAGALGKGVFKSINSGQSWSISNTGLIATNALTFAIDPTDTDILYVGTSGGGIFKSTDKGNAWNSTNSGLTSLGVTSVAINPDTPGTLFAGTNGAGVFKSSNGGSNWVESNAGLEMDYIGSIVIDPNTPTILYASTPQSYIVPPGTLYGTLCKSLDSGVSWTALSEAPHGINGTSNLTIDPRNTSTLYCTSGVFLTSIYKSLDGGQTWSDGVRLSDSETSSAARDIVIDPIFPDTLYAAGGYRPDGVYKSTDGGDQWVFVGGPIDATGWLLSITRLCIHYENPDMFFAGLGEHGVYVSITGGVNWSDFSNGIKGIGVNGITIDPESPDTVYAYTSGKGLVRLTLSPPDVTTRTPTAVTYNSAVLTGTINPMNLTAQWYFEINSPISPFETGNNNASGMESISIEQQVNGLSPGTEYRFRAVADTSLGTFYGEWKTFKTVTGTSGGGDGGGCFVSTVSND